MPNRLAHETSPYLRQHADNPVDWYPWGEEALEKASRENKPILLSIGYSACHWCHVMAHESFEDPAVAEVMNRHFVNIKVDREERPDLDKLYQTAHALLTGRAGGWPLTMFLSPQDQVPFFGGTYFPPEPRHGLPGFKELLLRVAEFHREHGNEIANQKQAFVAALDSLWVRGEAAGALEAAPLDLVRGELTQGYDRAHGGFGTAPKFPQATALERLLRHWAGTGGSDVQALEMVLHSLRRMAEGGIYDQLGGGFCRYSVDARWMIPHFEKMLYDNGPLLALYSEAAAATGDAYYARVARETAEWALREMQSPEGGFYSSLDADSEGGEGRYYLWNREAVQRLLDGKDYALFARRYGLDAEPNFEGRWHLYGRVDVHSLARDCGEPPEQVQARLDAARQRLLRAREARVRPGRDEKVLTAWNALMIKGLATAARHLQEPRYAEAAARAADFLHARLWRDGRLSAAYKDGRAHPAAYLDDYAFLLDALLALLQLRWRSEHLAWVVELAEVLLARFEDREHGGFYFTADDHEALLRRPKTYGDEAMPAGNAVAAQALTRLGYLLAEPRYLTAAERTLKSAAGPMREAPSGHTAMITALEEWLFPPQVVILRGRGEALSRWQTRAAAPYAPRRMVLAIPDEAADLPPALAEKRPQGEAVAYVCTGTSCSAPIHSLEALEAALGGEPPRGAALNPGP